MVLVVSNIGIEGAPALVDLFPAGAASLITGSDLYKSFIGSIYPDNFAKSRLRINGTTVTPAEIQGVITTVPAFLPVEFYYMDPADREYVCGEVNAFFLYFLNELRCMKCNPPDHKILIGWNVHKCEWIQKALDLNIPVASFRMKNGYETEIRATDNIIKCTCIFGSVLQPGLPETVQDHVLRLAESLSLNYLDCYFLASGGTFSLLGISTVPDISIEENRIAIADHFQKKAHDSTLGT